jgi:hypothetical protein
MHRERDTLVAIQTVSRASVEVAPNWKTGFRIHPALEDHPLQEFLGAATKKKKRQLQYSDRPGHGEASTQQKNKQTNKPTKTTTPPIAKSSLVSTNVYK